MSESLKAQFSRFRTTHDVYLTPEQLEAADALLDCIDTHPVVAHLFQRRKTGATYLLEMLEEFFHEAEPVMHVAGLEFTNAALFGEVAGSARLQGFVASARLQTKGALS